MENKIVPVPEQFVPRFKEILDIENRRADLAVELSAKATALWGEVKALLDARDRHITLNRETMELTVYGHGVTEEEIKMSLRAKAVGGMTAKVPVNVSTREHGNALPTFTAVKPTLLGRIRSFLGLEE